MRSFSKIRFLFLEIVILLRFKRTRFALLVQATCLSGILIFTEAKADRLGNECSSRANPGGGLKCEADRKDSSPPAFPLAMTDFGQQAPLSVRDDSDEPGASSVSLGDRATSHGTASVAIGYFAKSHASGAVAIGDGAEASELSSPSSDPLTSQGPVAIGEFAKAKGQGSVGIGRQAHAYAAQSISVGEKAVAKGGNSISLGSHATTEASDSVAIGANAAVVATNSVALGSGSFADRSNTVSVGGNDIKRQITNVAEGTKGDDAVTVSQLRTAGLIDKSGSALHALVYDNAKNSSITLGGVGSDLLVRLTNVAAGRVAEGSTDAVNGGQLFSVSSRVDGIEKRLSDNRAVPDTKDKSAPIKPPPSPSPATALDADGRRIPRVAAGVEESDAVNVGQLNAAIESSIRSGMSGAIQSANAHTDAQVERLKTEISRNRRDSAAGSASAIAIANLPQAYPGENMVSVAGGTFSGQSAVALGVSTSTTKWTVKASFTTNTRNSYGGGVGAGYRF